MSYRRRWGNIWFLLRPVNPECLKYAPPFLHFDTSIADKRVPIVNQTKITKIVDPDETACYDPFPEVRQDNSDRVISLKSLSIPLKT